jgi:phosphoglycolate phosphatase
VPRFRAVVTDLDNTLYPWVDYIVPSLEAMVASLVATTGLPRVRIVQALKAVYSKYESNEYPFAIQESGIFQPYEADFDSFNALVVRPAREAFRAARDRYLRPYPGVRETLDRLRTRGLKVVGLSDAPRNAAELRLKHLRLDGHFDALYTLPGYPLPENVDPEIRRKEEAGHYRSRTPVIELPHAAEKPSPAGLSRILSDFGLDGREVLYVGDNVKKDMPVAKACGAVGVWAEYGTYVSEEYRERLAIISASSVTRRHVADETPLRWPLAISSFTQVASLADGSSGAARARRPARRGGTRSARRRPRGRGAAGPPPPR